MYKRQAPIHWQTWAFEDTQHEYDEYVCPYEKIPNCDILITHENLPVHSPDAGSGTQLFHGGSLHLRRSDRKSRPTVRPEGDRPSAP